jgi:hypothetical protein
MAAFRTQALRTDSSLLNTAMYDISGVTMSGVSRCRYLTDVRSVADNDTVLETIQILCRQHHVVIWLSPFGLSF